MNEIGVIHRIQRDIGMYEIKEMEGVYSLAAKWAVQIEDELTEAVISEISKLMAEKGISVMYVLDKKKLLEMITFYNQFYGIVPGPEKEGE